MRLVIFGTGDFGVPAAEALYAAGYEVAALVTQKPVAVKNPKKAPPEPEIVRLAESHGTPVYRFEDVKSQEAVECLQTLNADLFFVCDYGQILSLDGIRAAKFGGINLHGSLLPRYRGSAPVQWAILNGDAETGITVIHITPTVDAGPILGMAATPIGPDETHPELEARLAKLGVEPVLAAVAHFATGEQLAEVGVRQDDALASKAPKIRKHHAEIRWSEPATLIRNKIRAYEGGVRTFTTWRRDGKPDMRLIPQAVPAIVPLAPQWETAAPGTVLAAGETLVVKTGDAALSFTGIQPSGKKMMTIPEFLRGYPLAVGERFI